MAKSVRAALSDTIEKLIAQYGCGPVKFSGTDEALYERHLLFDNVTDIKVADARDRFEAVARSVRDVLSQRWIRTEQTYESKNPKRVYYLSIEFLLGRSLANNVQNLLLDPVAEQLIKDKNLDRLGLLEQEPDAGLGNGGLGRLAACFLDSMATMQLPANGLRAALRIRDVQAVNHEMVGSRNARTIGCVARTLGKCLVRMKESNCSSTALLRSAGERYIRSAIGLRS